MKETISKFDIAIEHLNKISSQLQRGLISQRDFDAQQLFILVDLANACVNEFHNEEE